MRTPQELRVAFCDLIDEVKALDDAGGRHKRHLLWWFGKEALYHLGVLNGDIREESS